MSERTFTLEEAQALLPVMQALLHRAMEAKRRIEIIEKEFKELNQRVFMLGGARLEIGKLARRRAESDKAVQQVKDAMAEIESIGAQVKDLDIGLIDFPCNVDGTVILLCWKIGEPKIAHWHGAHEGFAARKPIDDHIARAKKSK